MDTSIVQTAIPLLTQFALRALGAIALWVIGRALIRFAVRVLVRTLGRPFDQTLAAYIGTATKVLLNIALVVAILGFFGVETTSFAALMAGVGVAIGAAWSGLTGPIESAELGGLDIMHKFAEFLLPDLDTSKARPRAVAELVNAGHFGLKSGKGVYDWSTRDGEALLAARTAKLFERLAEDAKRS